MNGYGWFVLMQALLTEYERHNGCATATFNGGPLAGEVRTVEADRYELLTAEPSPSLVSVIQSTSTEIEVLKCSTIRYCWNGQRSATFARVYEVV